MVKKLLIRNFPGKKSTRMTEKTSPLQHATLCFVLKGSPPDRVLLGMKKAGFGKGKIDGFGGKVEVGETAAQAAARELAEEAGLIVPPGELEQGGHLTFLFPFRPAWSQVVHAFLARRWQGEPVESEEMKPAWYRLEDIPYAGMWQDSAFWLPQVLRGERVRATFTFKEDNEAVEAVQFEPWEE
jgi:8-oxo-dGTP diphosphatase